MTKFEILYVKYLIKRMAFFNGFLLVFLALFLGMGLSLQLEVYASYPADVEGGQVVVWAEATLEPIDQRLYIYANRNERVYRGKWEEIYMEDNVTIIIPDQSNNLHSLAGGVTVELAVGKQSLLGRIFAKAGKG